MDAKQMLWKFLIRNGDIVADRNYYGNRLDYDNTRRWQVIVEQEDFLDYVDWDKTEDVEDGLMSVFRGTFCDNPDVKVLEGTLTTGKGVELEWLMHVDDINLTELILKVIQEAK